MLLKKYKFMLTVQVFRVNIFILSFYAMQQYEKRDNWAAVQVQIIFAFHVVSSVAGF